MHSLASIASLAGVSKATVSRVLNQRGNVHPQTVRQVRQAIDRAGYQAPFPKADRSRLTPLPTSLGTGVYALVVPEIAPNLYVSLLKGFESAATEQSFQSIICNTADNVYKQGHELLQLLHRKVSGVAMVPVATAATPAVHIQAMQAAGIPVVLLHRDVEGVSTPLVSLPLEAAGELAGNTLLAKGHQRIAMLSGPAGRSAALHRAGLEKALARKQIGLRDEWVHHLSPDATTIALSQAEVAKVFAGWDALPPRQRPTAIYTTNDTLAELVFMRMLTLGRRVPGDLSLISFGGQERGGVIASQITAVVVDEVAVGRSAVELIQQEARRLHRTEERIIHRVGISLAEASTLGAVDSRR